jgi:hypothetical protein
MTDNSKTPRFTPPWERELKNMPIEERTPEVCLEAVKQNAKNFVCVPHALKSPEMCAIAVAQCGANLAHVPKALKTAELCAVAVKQKGRNLEYVPKAFKTPELCSAAVEQNADNKYYVPRALWTPEIQNASNMPSRERERCQFCREKYGVAYPEDIGFGKIVWWNVPYFAMGTVGCGLKSIPRIRSEKTRKAREDLEKWEKSEEAAYLSAQMEKAWKEYESARKKYESEHNKYTTFLSDPEFDDRDLTRDELAQLGINFDPYRRNKPVNKNPATQGEK